MGQDNARPLRHPGPTDRLPALVFLAAVVLHSFINNKRQKTLKEIILI
jgi:hypothetical protein